MEGLQGDLGFTDLPRVCGHCGAFEEPLQEAAVRQAVFRRAPLKVLEQMFGIPRKTWSSWLRDGLPRRPDGYYDLYEVCGWLRQRWYTECVLKKAGLITDGEKAATERKRTAEANIKEMEEARLKGLLVSKENWERDTIARIAAVKRELYGMRNLAKRMERLDAVEVEVMLMEHIEGILRRFAGEFADQIVAIESEAVEDDGECAAQGKSSDELI